LDASEVKIVVLVEVFTEEAKKLTAKEVGIDNA
jgi:hypothetical protein